MADPDLETRVDRATSGVPVDSAVELWQEGDAGWHLNASAPSPGGDRPGESWDIWADTWDEVTGWFDKWSRIPRASGLGELALHTARHRQIRREEQTRAREGGDRNARSDVDRPCL